MKCHADVIPLYLNQSPAKPDLLVSEAKLRDVDEAEAVAHPHADAGHEPPGVDEPHVVGDDDQAEADHVRHGVHVEGRLAAADRVGEQPGGQGAEGKSQLGEAGHPAGLYVDTIWGLQNQYCTRYI